ncbi:MAG: hypothetical protein LAQ69_13005 [Acidobacteriia bacterium]|nr:hypothetical protein [Terriglobia bacterium]
MPPCLPQSTRRSRRGLTGWVLASAAVIITLAAVGLTACVLPARRATRVDPVTVPREQ